MIAYRFPNDFDSWCAESDRFSTAILIAEILTFSDQNANTYGGKESLFIQMLEALHKDDAKVLIDIKDKKLNLTYKGLTENCVKEAFNWNDQFTRN